MNKSTTIVIDFDLPFLETDRTSWLKHQEGIIQLFSKLDETDYV